jgi:hypothetical protein
VIKPGNHDQRELRATLQVTAPGARAWLQPLVIGTSVGSSSVPGSFLTLVPNGTIVVRGEAAATHTPEWRGRGLGETADIVVQAAINELYYDDNSYVMKSTSAAALLVGTARLFWRWR